MGAKELFRSQFGGEPEAGAFAPGRVNLIGEHTDYNQGFVFPVALDRGVTVVARRSADGVNRVVSAQGGPGQSFPLDVQPGQGEGWAKYPAAVVWALAKNGTPARTALECAVDGDLPFGGGISSSAALEVAFATLWNTVDGLGLDGLSIARLTQRAENDFVGVKCGIMDMMASALGVEGHALLIDTDSLAVTAIPFPDDLRVVVCDTGMDRALAGSAYNQRRAECEAACAELGISSLREAQVGEEMRVTDPIARKRARHVLTENERCLNMAKALQRGDRGSIGDLMAASHASLRDDYEVSSPELDAMVEAARLSPGFVGARMTGAGFGGCAVAICTADQTENFLTQTEQNYLNIVKGLRVSTQTENHRLPVPRVLAARPAQGSGPIVALGD